MATWITHLMISDIVLKHLPGLDERGFCAGSIAPDCNQENEDWTSFTPPREVTHWMQSGRKSAADCDRFRDEYLLPRLKTVSSEEEKSFLLGYWAHLIADAEHQKMIRDEVRVKAVWRRIRADDTLRDLSFGMGETWDNVKRLIPREERLHDMDAIDAACLSEHPDSRYLTVLLPLQNFPDYIDYLPKGCIERKIRVMGRIPQLPDCPPRLIALTLDEHSGYIQAAAQLITTALKKYV